MPAPLDFRALEPADALDLAVLMEEEARQRYIEFAELMEEVHHKVEAAVFFRSMVEHEERHGKALWQRRERTYPNAPHRVNASLLGDGEAPDFDTAVGFMPLERCMELALAAETRAEAFFRAALKEARDPEVCALFRELAREEVDHQRMVKDAMARLSGPAGPAVGGGKDGPAGRR